MSRSTSTLCSLLLVALSALLVAVALVGVRVHSITSPRRAEVTTGIDFADTELPVEPVAFRSADGLALRGWRIPGQAERPPVILCHDRGADKSTLIHLGALLNAQGFTLLLFDFRGHGESEASRSTLGLHEKRDVVGAVDFLLATEGPVARRVGVYGVGMGAHAAVLAAADRASIRALALDGLYPDAAWPLLRETFGSWDFGAERLGWLPAGAFRVLAGAAPGAPRAADVLPALRGRDVLLLASSADAELAVEMQRMYEGIPAQREADGNFVLLAGTQSQGLYGRDVAVYHRRVVEFLTVRLGTEQTVAAGSR
jgi:pimeloyl-ACP methyl ester carboxylesterase